MALIPPFFIDTVIAIGKQTGAGTSMQKQWIGTGFIYATFQKKNTVAKMFSGRVISFYTCHFKEIKI